MIFCKAEHLDLVHRLVMVSTKVDVVRSSDPFQNFGTSVAYFWNQWSCVFQIRYTD